MATHKWRLSRVKNNYEATSDYTVINNITEATVEDVDILTAEATQTLIDESIATFETSISATFATHVADFDSHITQYNLLNTIVDANNTELNALGVTVGLNTNSIATNAANLTSHIGNFDNLVAIVGANNIAFNALENTVANNTAAIATNAADISTSIDAFNAHVIDFNRLELFYETLTGEVI